MATPEAYHPPRGILNRLARKWCAARVVSPLRGPFSGFFVSLTFDDVPVSAAVRGGECLARRGVAATWYVASGLCGRTSVSGELLGPAGIRELADGGHEIAMHGHRHADMSRMAPEDALADIARGRDALAQMLGRLPSPHLAYPYGTTSVALKRRLRDVVATARGAHAGVNRAGSDAMQLAAYDLRPDPATISRAREGIERAARCGGWVILFTHDVALDPSAFGTTPQALDGIVHLASELGAQILPVGAVWDRLGGVDRGDQST